MIQQRYETISGADLYKRLSTGQPAFLLDVRTASEFDQRHIPGSRLIPLHDLESRVKEVPNSGTPIAVVCAGGNRSASACKLLAEYGLGPLFTLEGGLENWPGPVHRGAKADGRHRHKITPAPFLVDNFHLLPKGLALDVAMGAGRNAIFLATRGFDVDGVDVDPQAVTQARASARRLGAPIRAVVANLEDGTWQIPAETYDTILVFSYLHRPLFSDLKRALRRGGVLVFETYTVDQVRFGKPSSLDHLLQPGELRDRFSGWEILAYRESIEPGRLDGKMRARAGIVARKP